MTSVKLGITANTSSSVQHALQLVSCDLQRSSEKSVAVVCPAGYKVHECRSLLIELLMNDKLIRAGVIERAEHIT